MTQKKSAYALQPKRLCPLTLHIYSAQTLPYNPYRYFVSSFLFLSRMYHIAYAMKHKAKCLQSLCEVSAK